MDPRVEQLKIEVFSRQKTLAEIYKTYGHVSLSDYANEWQVGEFRLADVFVKALEAQVNKLYPDIAQKVVNQLQTLPLVSTIDHLGILNHPFFINSNLIFSLRKNIKYLICLPTAGVSLNNSSWPGCLIRHDEKGHMRRSSFFPDRLKNLPVFSAPAIALPFPPYIGGGIEGGVLNTDDLINNLFDDESIFNFPNFSEQACVLSVRFWQLIFPAAPKLIYVPLEDLVASLVVDVIGQDDSHILHKLIFTKAGWQLLDKYFHGLKGAFDGGYGTFLFWQVDEKGRRVRLPQPDMPIQPQSVCALLNQRKIYPGSLLCFLVLLYNRITCLGGFNQVNWLTEIKEKFVQLLKELGELDEAAGIAKVPTNNFAEGNFSFLYQTGQLIKPTGWDIFSLGNKQIYEKYQNLAQAITVAESIETLLPEIYKIITPAQKRSRELLILSDEAIAELAGLKDKVHSVMG